MPLNSNIWFLKGLNGERKLPEIDDHTHIWGESVEPLLLCNDNQLFDVALAAECLWRHELHDNLVQSIVHCLKPGGWAYIVFSHHGPEGTEDKDLAFFEIAEREGLLVTSHETELGAHMWTEDKQVEIHTYQLVKKVVNGDNAT